MFILGSFPLSLFTAQEVYIREYTKVTSLPVVHDIPYLWDWPTMASVVMNVFTGYSLEIKTIYLLRCWENIY